MEKDAREKRGDDVSEGACRENESEIGPGERGEIRVKKAGETENPEDDPGIDECGEVVGPVGEVNLAEIGHAALEQDVARAVAAGDGEIDQGFLEGHAVVRVGARVFIELKTSRLRLRSPRP